LRITLIFVGILLLGTMLFVGCTNGGTPGGGLDFFGSGDQGTATGTPTPTPTAGEGEEFVLADGRTSTYDLVIDGAYVYWTEYHGSTDSGVFRTLLDGSGPVEEVATGYPFSCGLCIVGNDLYFSTRNALPEGSIVHVDLSGGFPFASRASEIYVAGLNFPQWVRHANGFIYWTEWDPLVGQFNRVPVGQTAPATTLMETVLDNLSFPFAFTLDPIADIAIVSTVAADDATIFWCQLAANQTATDIAGGGEDVWYVTSVKYDSANNTVYWANCVSNSGVFRNTVDGQGFEVIERSQALAVDLFGPANGRIYYDTNMQRQEDGNIFFDEINNLGDPSQTDIEPDDTTTITSPFRFEIMGGSYFWTEYPDFQPDVLDAGGSTQCRVMRYTP